MQLLLVEDDEALARGITTALKREGFAVNHVADGKSALYAAENASLDIVVLDLGLPDMDGMEVLQKLRQRKFPNPVLLLTARSTLQDKVTGLDGGADDYLAKPFDMEELLARLRALERRVGSVKSKEISIGEVSLDTSAQQVLVNGNAVTFARREFMLLKTLMESAGRIQTRENLENKLYSWDEETASNTIEVHIHHLRKKLPPDFIKTVRGRNSYN